MLPIAKEQTLYEDKTVETVETIKPFLWIRDGLTAHA